MHANKVERSRVCAQLVLGLREGIHKVGGVTG